MLARSFTSLSPASVVDDISHGMGLITDVVASNAHGEYQQRLIAADLLSVVLDLLSRCKEDFPEVLVDLGAEEGRKVYLAMPTTWVSILNNIALVETRWHVQIAGGISPLVKIICDDSKREFFQSNMYWHNALLPSLILFTRLLDTEEARKLLLQNRGIVKKVIRCIFWKMHRPDIMEESSSRDSFLRAGDRTTLITNTALDFMYCLLCREKSRAEEVATTPILSKEMKEPRPLFVIELFQLLKSKDPAYSDNKRSLLVLKALIEGGVCSKKVITEIVDFGLNRASTYMMRQS